MGWSFLNDYTDKGLENKRVSCWMFNLKKYIKIIIIIIKLHTHSNVFVHYRFVKVSVVSLRKMAIILKPPGFLFYNFWHTSRCQLDLANKYVKFQIHLHKLSRVIKRVKCEKCYNAETLRIILMIF